MWRDEHVANAVPHLRMDEGVGPERLVQIGATINHQEGDRGLHEQDDGPARRT